MLKAMTLASFIFAVLLLSLSACGRGSHTPVEDGSPHAFVPPLAVETEAAAEVELMGDASEDEITCPNSIAMPRALLAENERALRVLVIPSAHWLEPRNIYTSLINQANRQMRDIMAESVLDFYLERVPICWSCGEDVQLYALLNSDYPPDLIMVLGHPVLTFAKEGHFADIYKLIDNDPELERSDFFENVLEAFEVDGRLVAFPMLFSPQMVGIGANMPESIIDKFVEKQFISTGEISQLYRILQTTYEGFEDYRAIDHKAIHSTLALALADSLNITERTHDLNAESLSSFLTKVYPLLAMSSNYMSLPFHIPGTYSHMFSNKFSGMNLSQALMETEEPYFIHHIPLVSDDGSLILAPAWSWQGFNPSTFAIADGENTALAWEFMKVLMDLYAHTTTRTSHLGMGSLATSILRYNFAERTEAGFAQVFSDNWIGSAADEAGIMFTAAGNAAAEREAVESATIRLAGYVEMPMVMPPMEPLWMFRLECGRCINCVRDDFLNGTISADEAAQQIIEKVEAWLNE